MDAQCSNKIWRVSVSREWEREDFRGENAGWKGLNQWHGWKRWGLGALFELQTRNIGASQPPLEPRESRRNCLVNYNKKESGEVWCVSTCRGKLIKTYRPRATNIFPRRGLVVVPRVLYHANKTVIFINPPGELNREKRTQRWKKDSRMKAFVHCSVIAFLNRLSCLPRISFFEI